MANKIVSIFLVLSIVGVLQSCNTKTSLSTVSISIDSTQAYLPEIKIKVNQSLKTQIAKKTEWETIAGLFSINNNKVSPYSVTCNYSVKGDTLILQPILPLGMQTGFEVQVYTKTDTLKKQFTTPTYTNQKSKPAVSSIYPLGESVPTNILMFHVTFTTPMVEDDLAFQDILIVDEKGKEKPKVWREKSSWSNNGKHLVLMVHPGRVKKGIEYMDKYGVLFEAGKQYTLVVPKHLKDKYGKPLGKEYRKTYTITAMDTTIPAYNKMPIAVKANTSTSLDISFSEPIDYGTAQIGIEVINANNKKCEGELVAKSDKEWQFIPTSQWQKGSYTLKFNDYVADLASNHLTRKFEVKNLDSLVDRQGLAFKFKVK